MSFDLGEAVHLVPGLIAIGKFSEFGSDTYELYSLGFADYKTALAGLPKLSEADADKAIASIASIMKIMWMLAADPKQSPAAMRLISGLLA